MYKKVNCVLFQVVLVELLAEREIQMKHDPFSNGMFIW